MVNNVAAKSLENFIDHLLPSECTDNRRAENETGFLRNFSRLFAELRYGRKLPLKASEQTARRNNQAAAVNEQRINASDIDDSFAKDSGLKLSLPTIDLASKRDNKEDWFLVDRCHHRKQQGD